MSRPSRNPPSKLSTDDLSIDVRNWQPPAIAASITIDAPEWRGYAFGLILYGLEVAEFEVRRDDPDAAPLNSWRLQHVPLALLERGLRAKVAAVFEQMQLDNPDLQLFDPEQWPSADERPRANRDDARLAKIAKRYVETLGRPAQVAELAAHFGYSTKSMPKLIRRARDRHLLTATTKGRAGGQLTPKALALLGVAPNVPGRAQWETFMFGRTGLERSEVEGLLAASDAQSTKGKRATKRRTTKEEE